jgi:hypothetical protein
VFTIRDADEDGCEDNGVDKAAGDGDVGESCGYHFCGRRTIRYESGG